MAGDVSGGAGSAGEPTRSFEEMLGRLEEVVESLEGGGLSLDESLRLFEEGISLSRLAAGRIDEAERRIEELLSDGTVTSFREVQAAEGGEDR